MKFLGKSACTKFFVAALAIMSLSCVALAQTPPAPATPATPVAAPATATTTPTMDQILSRYVESIGGRAAWQKLTSRQSIGTIDIPAMNLSGTLQVHEKAPSDMLSVVVIAGAAFRRGFDGKTGWSDDPQNGVRELSGPELAEARQQAGFYHSIELAQTYSKLSVVGTEKIGDQDAYVVDATPVEGAVVKLYFDMQTGLMVRIKGQRHTPQGAMDFQEDLSDYRDADGIKLPFTIRQAAGGAEFTIRITEVHHNVALDDSQFAKPAAQ
ncbi:MAG: hypothetical protein WBP79_12975 [Candidatus Acidiferrales bacterium]